MSIIGQIKDKVTQYVDVYVKLFKVDFILRTSNVMSYFMFAMIGLLLLFCVALFLGFGLVELFIVLECSKLASFFIVIGIYALMFWVVYLRRNAILRFFASTFIRVLTEGDEDDEERKEKEPK